MVRNILVLSTLLLAASFVAEGSIVRTDHVDFTVYTDCSSRNPALVVYSVGRDTGNAPRHDGYIADNTLNSAYPNCHPILSHKFKTYQSYLKRTGVDKEYDVGHVAASNHLDRSVESSKTANVFSNLSPQVSSFNRRGGAWYETESITECHRDQQDMLVLAGTLDDAATTEQDYFVNVWGQTTADYWWKIVYWSASNEYAAWLLPNSQASTASQLYAGSYDVSLEHIKNVIVARYGDRFDVLNLLDAKRPTFVSKEKMLTRQVGKVFTCNGKTAGVG